MKLFTENTTPSHLVALFACIDHTSLNTCDTNHSISDVCKSISTYNAHGGVAAICVYPPFVELAKEYFSSTKISIATVVGAFPSGQTTIPVKIAETKNALDAGANEIDMVLSVGKVLAGEFSYVKEEIMAIKEICGNNVLKVIIETGELKTKEMIQSASEIAIAAGADFIKTSTGKMPIGATLEAFNYMLQAIKTHHEKTGLQVGIKAAGGITEVNQAMEYLKMTQDILGDEWLSPTLFRVGASRLTEKLYRQIVSI